MKTEIFNSNSCLICGGSNLKLYLDLGLSALANSYLPLNTKGLEVTQTKYPLRVYYCTDCRLAQLLDIVDRKLLFSNYAYYSSTSPQLLGYFKDYSVDIYRKFPKQTEKLTVEIASNDGILLKYFQSLGAKVLGVDPAENIAQEANNNGVPTLPVFFNTGEAKSILNQYGSAGIITANNVLAHTDILHEIIAGVKLLLAPDGVFVFEVQYLGDLISKNEFDNTYHEHICYFSLAPLITLLKKYDLEVFDVQRVSGQGGSLRVFAGHSPLIHPINNTAESLLKEEQLQGLYNFKTYQDFATKPEKIKDALLKLLREIKQTGKSIVGYGAPAKGNTLLQYCGIDSKLIDYIVDEAPSKQERFAPGSLIPIFSPKKLLHDKPDYILILAWNYADSIIAKENKLSEQGVKFIIPIPEIKII